MADLPIGRSPSDVATGAGSSWVLDANDQTISQIDPQTRSVAQTFGAGAEAGQLTGGQLAAVGDGALWVTDAYTRTIWRVRIGGVTGRRLDLGQTSAIALGANSVWLTNDQASTVTRIDPETLRIVKVIQLPAPPQSIAIGGGLVWVSVV